MTLLAAGPRWSCPFQISLRRTWLLAIALACSGLHAQPVSAGPSSPLAASKSGSARQAGLTLDQAIALALERHPDLAAARAELPATLAATEQAGLLPNPEIEASLEDTRTQSRTTAVRFSQRLELGGKRQARVEAAQQAEAVAAARLKGLQARIQSEVRTSFWEALAAQARVDLSNSLAQLAQDAAQAAEKRVAAGKVSPVEETRALLAASGARLEVAQTKADLHIARTRLAALWSAPESALPSLEGALQVAAEVDPTVIEQRLQDAPEVLEARLEAARVQALVEVERSRVTSDVTVGIGVQRNNELGRNQALLGVSVPLPLFDRNQGHLKEAIARADQARYALEAKVSSLRAQAQVALAQAQSLRSQALLVESELLPKAQSAYEATSTGFTLGKFAFLDVLDAQRSLFQTRLQHLKALADSQRAAADIDRILGTARADVQVTTQRAE